MLRKEHKISGIKAEDSSVGISANTSAILGSGYEVDWEDGDYYFLVRVIRTEAWSQECGIRLGEDWEAVQRSPNVTPAHLFSHSGLFINYGFEIRGSKIRRVIFELSLAISRCFLPNLSYFGVWAKLPWTWSIHKVSDQLK